MDAWLLTSWRHQEFAAREARTTPSAAGAFRHGGWSGWPSRGFAEHAGGPPPRPVVPCAEVPSRSGMSLANCPPCRAGARRRRSTVSPRAGAHGFFLGKNAEQSVFFRWAAARVTWAFASASWELLWALFSTYGPGLTGHGIFTWPHRSSIKMSEEILFKLLQTP